jgi:hypothetical protein
MFSVTVPGVFRLFQADELSTTDRAPLDFGGGVVSDFHRLFLRRFWILRQ